MRIAIIQYNAGNIMSVEHALHRLGFHPVVTADPDTIRSADRVIFPGVGEASTTMKYLRDRKLDELICSLNQPVLGICLGLQLMCRYSEEGNTSCLGIFNAEVRRFSPVDTTGNRYKIPHMGWNQIENLNGGLFAGMHSNPYMYFVHSYCASIGENTTATCQYSEPFSAALQWRNFYATQFHPEKSGSAGLNLLKSFLHI